MSEPFISIEPNDDNQLDHTTLPDNEHYRRVFLSFAHQDRSNVLLREQKKYIQIGFPVANSA